MKTTLNSADIAAAELETFTTVVIDSDGNEIEMPFLVELGDTPEEWAALMTAIGDNMFAGETHQPLIKLWSDEDVRAHKERGGRYLKFYDDWTGVSWKSVNKEEYDAMLGSCIDGTHGRWSPFRESYSLETILLIIGGTNE